MRTDFSRRALRSWPAAQPVAPGWAPRLMAARGVTLIELMVALSITTIMKGAVVTLIGIMTRSVTLPRIRSRHAECRW